MSTPDLRATAYRGMKWSAVSTYTSRAIRMFALLVLAGLIGKAEFGLLQVATVIILITGQLSDLGIGQAMIWHRGKEGELNREAFDTGSFMVMGINLFLIVLIYFSAPWIADFVENERATAVIRALIVCSFLNMLVIAPRAMIEKQIDFKRAFFPETIPAVISAVVSIVLALILRNVWALVAGQIASALTRAILYHWAARWFPRFHFQPALCAKLLKFSLPLVGAGLIGMAISVTPSALIVKFVDTTALGVYGLADRISAFPLYAITYVVGRVMFPVYAQLRDKPDDLRAGMREALRLITLFSSPVCIGMIAVIPAAELNVYHGKWWDLPLPLAIMMLFSYQRTIGSIAGDLSKAMGRTGLIQMFFGARLVALVPACTIGAFLWGLNGAVLGLWVSSTFGLFVEFRVIYHLSGIRAVDIFDGIKVTLSAGCVSAIVASIAVNKHVFGPTWFGLGVGVLAGAIVYFAIIVIYERPILSQVKRAVLGGRGAKPQAALTKSD